jgi:hypothetical protein
MEITDQIPAPKDPEKADCPSAPCSQLSDLLPPAEIVEAAERVKVWMEVNGYQNWQLAGICDRRIAYQRDQMESALMLAARWGISSDGYSAEVSSRIRCWIIGGMKGEAPKAPDYYPANVNNPATGSK